MRRECIAAVGKAAGRILSDAELKRLEKDILTEYKNTSVSLSNHERLILAGKAAKDNMSKATARIITTEVSNARKITAHSADINTAPAGKRLQRLMDKFMHRASSVDASTEFKQISHVIEHTKGLSELTKKHKREILADPKAFERDVLSIQLGHKVDNPLAQKFVDEHMRINDKLHLEAVENNIPFDKRAHRIAQYWDTDKLHQAGRHQFIERMHDALDKDHIAYKKADGSRQSDEWFTDLLSHTYIERLEAHSEPFHSPYGGTVGSFREKERVLHLVNDPDVHLKIREEFGSDKGIADTLIADITKLSRDVVMAREWGTKPEATLKKLISDLHKADMLATNGSNETKTFFGGNRLDYDKNMLLAGVDIMLHGETPHNAVWSARHRALRSILSAAQLGGHVIAAFIEDGWIAGQMLDRQGMDRTVLKEFRNLPKASRLKLASEIGVLSEHSLAIQSRDMGGELADKMHEWAGAGALDKRRKSEYQMVVSEQIGKSLDTYATLAELQADPHLNPDLKKFMNQFNAVDFQVMKHAEKVSSPEGDWSMRSSKTIRNVEDEAIQDFVKSRVKDANPHYVEKLKEHESKRQRKIDAEAKQIEEANVSKVRDYDAKGKHLESDIVLTDKERSKAVKAKEKDIKILNERIESELKLKQKASEDIIKPAEHKIGRIEKEKIKIQKSFAVNEEKLAKLAEKNKELTTQRDKTPKNLLDKRGREEYNLEHLSALKERVRQGWNDPKTKKALEKLPLIKSRLARINSEIANRKLGFDKNIAIIGEKIKPYKEKQESFKKILSAKDKEIGELKATIEKHKNPTINPKLIKERFALNESLYDLSSAKGRNDFLFHSREKAYSHRKNREDFLGGLEASKQEKLRPIENYMSEEMKVIQNHLNAEIAKEASRLKNEVANKWNAILASQTQTSLRGASSSTLRDKYRMGLLQHKKGSFAGELFRYAQQYITTPYSMLLNAYDMYQASKTGAEASMRLAGIERQYITTVILSGIATATIKALLRGEDPTSKGVVVDGILTNGALIPYGDKLYSLLLEKDGLGILGSAPSVVANATSAIKKGLTGEKGASVAGIRTVRNVIPFMNLWYIKGAFDHLILNSLLEWANPGYNERSQKNQEKHGKRFFWDKNSPLPNRMPEANLW